MILDRDIQPKVTYARNVVIYSVRQLPDIDTGGLKIVVTIVLIGPFLYGLSRDDISLGLGSKESH